MMFRLKTVRAKLTMLVALSIVMMLATLPVLSWLLHRQLIDEVDDRVTEAEKSFKEELKDDLSDLSLAARVLASDPATAKALGSSDETDATKLANLFLGVYPNIDFLFVDAKGKVLADVGCSSPPQQITELKGVAAALTGKEYRGVVEHGCER